MDTHKMKDVTSFVILFLIASFSSFAQSCRLKENIVSLSGPFSFALKEIGLESDKKFIGASNYHIFLSQFSGKKIGGGIYLSSKSFYEFKEPFTLFIDESVDLKKTLMRAQSKLKTIKKIREIKSRGKDSFSFSMELLNVLKEMTESCDKEIEKVANLIGEVKDQIQKSTLKQKVIFSLGKRRSDSYVVTKDLFMTSLKQIKHFYTYDSDNAYTKISSKLMKKYHDFSWCELKQVKGNLVLERNPGGYILKGAAVLTPGISQVHIIQKWLASFSQGASEKK